jgi:cytochrome P450 PksS
MEHISLNELLAQDTKRDPGAFFTRLRAQAPLCRIDQFAGQRGAWIALDYEDAAAILKDPRFTRQRPGPVPPGAEKDPTHQRAALFAWRQDMLTVDPPDHTRLRGLVSKAFTPRMIEQLRPRIEQITNELLDAVQPRGKMDLISEFAYPLPITVISEMMGIPHADRHQFRIWTQAILRLSEHLEQEAVDAVAAFVRYIQALLADKRAHPGSDLTSGLVHAEEGGDVLSEQELISTIFLLIVAGHETTVNLIGNGTLALLQHPDQLHLLQREPSLIPAAVEELLRYSAPVSLSTPRWAQEDIALRGQVIRKGDVVLASLAGANMDAQHFTEPARLDVTRAENKHLAFGKGIHFCLGAPLARLEAQIAFAALLQRLPGLRLDCDPAQLRWAPTLILRGLTALPVAF